MKRLFTTTIVAGLLLTSSIASAQTLLGAYYGKEGWAMDDVTRLESWQGKKNAVIGLYSNWTETSEGLLFTYQLPYIWEHGNVPLITWEPYLAGTTPDNIETRIAQGEYDSYLDSWGKKLRQFLAGGDGIYGTEDDRHVYIRLAHEPNGNWYPWSAKNGVNTPADYIAMWQKIWGSLDAQGLDRSHLQWIWSVNNVDSGAFSMEDYYPGDAYVDWVGVDGFNWGTAYNWSSWQSPHEIFDPVRARIAQLAPTKPVALTEVASTATTSSGVSSTLKDNWISQLSTYLQEADIRLVSWFNQDKETNWQLFAGQYGTTQADGLNVYPAYRTFVQNALMIPADETNPRILTDQQFQGVLTESVPLVANTKKCRVAYNISSRWTGGYVSGVHVTANYTIPRTWKLVWGFTNREKISSGWNAQLQQTAQQVTVIPPSWWQWMPAGAEPDFGFVGSGIPATPTQASLNGIPCEITMQ